jgi:hypothetical protein
MKISLTDPGFQRLLTIAFIHTITPRLVGGLIDYIDLDTAGGKSDDQIVRFVGAVFARASAREFC